MWSRVIKLYPPFLVEVLELKANKLRAIVDDNLLRNAEMEYEILPYEVLDFTIADLMESLNLDPLCEVLGDSEHVNPLGCGHWEFADDVHPLFH